MDSVADHLNQLAHYNDRPQCFSCCTGIHGYQSIALKSLDITQARYLYLQRHRSRRFNAIAVFYTNFRRMYFWWPFAVTESNNVQLRLIIPKVSAYHKTLRCSRKTDRSLSDFNDVSIVGYTVSSSISIRQSPARFDHAISWTKAISQRSHWLYDNVVYHMRSSGNNRLPASKLKTKCDLCSSALRLGNT